MKTCECGGTLRRYCAAKSKYLGDGQRYRCAACGKSITVRNGSVATKRGRPPTKDWREEGEAVT
jgi:transposase-like protein